MSLFGGENWWQQGYDKGYEHGVQDHSSYDFDGILSTLIDAATGGVAEAEEEWRAGYQEGYEEGQTERQSQEG